ncbi:MULTISPECIES: DUF960 domain-containing protein [Loigolactobacillus]|uniref:GTP cyclohydrolase n=1 Tax=Loigolactobacillus backii TaxID=375175 RepID=A0A192H2U7_9LACO|nr:MULTISPECIES: DUF960 domain-containing protein [Loigolactobacillus]ANK60283.1 GTP cyclohydrolase [Loigolactobacillus backii]ANK62276.1 GTP cyclohydrolase [Loigolactobacillus backii]ANK65165.1 GTP cyclohydrolase [Loigolactobacillus backii]ANK67724.1 GTP cyclohydrolase [Loigolactobacillus backii]ANK70711.1 GTP cyclohydrolase [Loigolactobacillus backii]
MFENNRNRFATYGVIAQIPGELIDQVWSIIDNNLQGIFPLGQTLAFQLTNHNGTISYDYIQDNDVVASFDTDFPSDPGYPDLLLAYDDGENQTILLPDEANNN